MKRKTLFISALVLLALLVTGGILLYRMQAAGEQAVREALVRTHPPTLGPAGAPVHIVEFFDPACETCVKFYPMVKRMMAERREDIRLSVRYAPFHPGSLEVVKALEASRKQGLFWPAMDMLVASHSVWVRNHRASIELAWPFLARTGLDMDRLKADMAAPDVLAAIAQDEADSRTLEVMKTPEFFVNGRPLPSFGWEQLRGLVQEELAATAPRPKATGPGGG
ncbi:MAG: thioredoxin domain-containing protein [Burkholderiales bacterium]|nr:thioredoxin domain-containing protein [Burkholderiales bacterium]